MTLFHGGIMKIAPIDIAHKTFSRKVMGLDSDEVADFLRECADQMEEVIRERNALKEMIRQRDLQIMEYKERDESLKATIQTATKMSEQIRIDAEREAKLIIGDSAQKAELILKDSRDSLKRVYQEIADIKRLRMQFEVNMRSLVQAHISMLDQGHYVMPDPQINLAHAASVTSGGAIQSHSANSFSNSGSNNSQNIAPNSAVNNATGNVMNNGAGHASVAATPAPINQYSGQQQTMGNATTHSGFSIDQARRQHGPVARS